MKHFSRSVVPVRCISSAGVPVASTRPASIATIQSHFCASSMYAVEMTTLMPGRPARMSSISAQNCCRDSGSTPVVGSSRISRSGSWTSAPHSPTFCFIPPDSLPAGRSANGPSPVACEQLLDADCALRGRQPEQPRHEVDVVADAELEIQVLPQALRHVGDARAHRAPVPDVGHVAVEDGDLSRPASSSTRRPAPSASTCRRRRGRRCRP